MYDFIIHIFFRTKNLIKKNKHKMKTILIIMIAVGLRLIYSVIFEYPSLLIGFVGTGLTVFCLFALLQEFRDSKKK